MAKKATPPKGHCRQCKHHYGDHELNSKGEFFLTKCPFFKWSRFLDKDSCEKYDGIIN